MIRSLESAAHPVWDRIKTPDGFEIDSHRENVYYDTLTHLKSLRQANAQYLSTEEINSYEFPPVNIESLKQQLDKCESYDQASNFTLDIFRNLNDTSFANRQMLNRFLNESREVVTSKPTQLELDFRKSQEEWTAKRAIEEAAAREKRENSLLYKVGSKLLEGKDTLLETGSRFIDSVKGFGKKILDRFDDKSEEETEDQNKDALNEFVTTSTQEEQTTESQQNDSETTQETQQKIIQEKEQEKEEQEEQGQEQ